MSAASRQRARLEASKRFGTKLVTFNPPVNAVERARLEDIIRSPRSSHAERDAARVALDEAPGPEAA
jgi:hypothetical protein